MGEVNRQEYPEINSNQPNKLLRDCLTMRLAYEIANTDQWANQVEYSTKAEAYLSGSKLVGDLDKLAKDDGLMGRPVVMSGPSVTYPETMVMVEDGTTYVRIEKPANAEDESIIRSYNDHVGNFYGFCVVVKRLSSETGQHYTPQLAYLMKTGKSIFTPVISGDLTAYGLVKNTDIHFIEDEIALRRESYINEVAEKSRDMGQYVNAQVELFMTCLDRTLITENLVDMVGALEKIANYYDDQTATSLLDTMTDMLKQYLAIAPEYNHIRPKATFIYSDSLDVENGPALRMERFGRKQTFSLVVQDIVFMPKYNCVSQDGRWSTDDELAAYFVYIKRGEYVYAPAASAEVTMEAED